MMSLVNYGDSDDDIEDETQVESTSDSQNSVSSITPHSSVSNPTSVLESPKNSAATSTVGETLPLSSSSMALSICAAPDVVPMGNENDRLTLVDRHAKEIMVNLTCDELFAPELGPANPFLSQQQRSVRNMLSGFVEQAHLNAFEFENQRRTFTSFGYAVDPSINTEKADNIVARIPDVSLAKADIVPPEKFTTVFEKTIKRPADKRKRKRNDDPSDLEGFVGPWAPFVDEKRDIVPSEEEAAELEEYLAKRHKMGKHTDDKPMEEKTILHIKDPLDYQGRNFLHPPQDVGVNLKSDVPPTKCFLPKSHIHTWKGHTKGISAIRWFPRTSHLLLSSSMDCRVKLWEVYHERRCIRTYYGHRQAVRDICFNNDGTQFLSAAYDRFIKLWDTETGACVSRFTSRKVAYCVKFNPEADKQHLFVAGTSDKKIICWDTRSGEIVQEYDRHLGAVNTITFVDENRRFVTTSDDKSLRVWECASFGYEFCRMHGKPIMQKALHPSKSIDYVRRIAYAISSTYFSNVWRTRIRGERWGIFSEKYEYDLNFTDWRENDFWTNILDIPVDMKYIADPSMHSMPAVTLSPNQKWLACQSMDNKIVIFSALNRFKFNRKKTFSGHMVAGYACTLDFSPDMSYIVSGDGDGKCYVWDWKTTKMFKKWKAHDSVCISALWNPHETSKIVTAGWDGLIKYWD